MIELTEQQRRELNRPDPEVIDPETKEVYVLIPKAVYARFQQMLDDDPNCITAELMDEIMAEDDANDPYLAELQKKYGGVQ